MPVYSNSGPSLESKIIFLSRPESYVDHPSQVEVIETHMSWVFLTERFVYKLKKPVRYDFLDFSTLYNRHLDCQEEVRLNRRLAPEVYLGIVALTADDYGHLTMDGNGKTVEWLVKMLRLPAERMLDYIFRKQQVDEKDIWKLTCKLASFYQNAKPVAIKEDEYRQRFLRDIGANHAEFLNHDYGLPFDQLNQITNAQLALLNNQPELFNRRVQEKCIIEAHGDLRPEHICLTDDPVVIDCLEFNRELRILDRAHELAYLAMECQFADAGFIESIVFDTYRHETDDNPPDLLIRFYKAYQATLRAKLAIWHIADHQVDEYSKWIERAKAYLQLAEQYSASIS